MRCWGIENSNKMIMTQLSSLYFICDFINRTEDGLWFS